MKIHLRDSAEPLKPGGELSAMCGEIVPKVAFAFMWDHDLTLAKVALPLQCCRKCYLAIGLGRYLYGIVPGEELIREYPVGEERGEE